MSDSKTNLLRLKDQYPICEIANQPNDVARKIKFVSLRKNRWNFITNLISHDAFDSRGVRVESQL